MVISCLRLGALREPRADRPCELGAKRLRLHVWMSTGEPARDRPAGENPLGP